MYTGVGASAECPLTVNHVIAIFEEDLPFVEDWTKPDRKCLSERMEAKGAAKLIMELGRIQPPFTENERKHYVDVLGKTIYCFRELTLTALVLQHVYPERFAMCSHHLASQLYITAPTVPEFYARYCEELKDWSEHEWPTPHKLTVVETEYALWTWYRSAYHGKNSDQRRKIQREFSKDRWVQKRRAKQIANSLDWEKTLDLARSYLDNAPTVAAIIAWREFEVGLRRILGDYETPISRLFGEVKQEFLPRGYPKDAFDRLWNRTGFGRNWVMHRGAEISQEDAAKVLDLVDEFMAHNRTE